MSSKRTWGDFVGRAALAALLSCGLAAPAAAATPATRATFVPALVQMVDRALAALGLRDEPGTDAVPKFSDAPDHLGRKAGGPYGPLIDPDGAETSTSLAPSAEQF